MAPPPSHSQAVLPNPKSLILDRVERDQNQFILTVRTRQPVACPRCGESCISRHSEYIRTIQDLPWQGLSVYIKVRVRRFRCRNPSCRQKVFAERLPGIASRRARRTDRLGSVIRFVGYSAGGLPGSRLLDRLAVQVSDDTVLRVVKHRPSPCDDAHPVRHAGVDDWAWRKGQRYGTIVVDLERHKVVDVLPNRSADDVAVWLHAHPTVKTINRDRCGTYADGAARGAPNAVQIADRFHLVLNLSTAMERAMEERRGDLHFSETEPVSSPDPKPDNHGHDRETAEKSRQQQRRQRRLERYHEVVALHANGHSQSGISEALGISIKTVRRWLRSGQFPERKPVIGRYSHVRQFEAYLRQRWEQGCHNSYQLFREIRLRGYQGCRQMVSNHVCPWRKQAQGARPQRTHRLAPKDAAILICKRPEHRSPEQERMFATLIAHNADFYWMHLFAIDFRDILQGKDAGRMHNWIRDASESGIGPLMRFAYGLRRDLQAVIAAVETTWSSGQVEGQINRLKSIKRQMYGRAGFALLRARVLPYGEDLPP
jgi:transposase